MEVNIRGDSPSTGGTARILGEDGALTVRPTAAVGGLFSVPITAPSSATPTYGTTNSWSNSTGAKHVRFSPSLLTSVTLIVMAVSDVVDEQATLDTLIDGVIAALGSGTPDGVARPNLRIWIPGLSTPLSDQLSIGFADGARIKTCVVKAVGADAEGALEIIT